MNREIKFRVWHHTLNKFIPADEWYLDLNGRLCFLDIKGITDDYLIEVEENLYTAQQYTGLKDMNGKEIYEGDIISYWPSCAKGYNNTIVKVPELTAFHWFAELEMMLDKSEYPNQCEIEVIGNIFKNPNLLDNTSKI